jgi:hypothetical protein
MRMWQYMELGSGGLICRLLLKIGAIISSTGDRLQCFGSWIRVQRSTPGDATMKQAARRNEYCEFAL